MNKLFSILFVCFLFLGCCDCNSPKTEVCKFNKPATIKYEECPCDEPCKCKPCDCEFSCKCEK